MEHTKELWNTNGDPIVFDTTGVVAFTDTRTNLDKVNKANARRIVACVNACAGLETELLESIVLTGETLKSRFDLLKAEIEAKS